MFLAFKKEDIDISLENKILKIVSTKGRVRETKNATLHTTERSLGGFTKILQLPDNADADNIDASFKNGVLTLTIPKTKESVQEAKKITIGD